MARKRLSDLLREEAQKSSDGDATPGETPAAAGEQGADEQAEGDNQTPDTAVQEKPESSTASSKQQKSQPSNADSNADTESSPSAAPGSDSAHSTQPKRSNLTKAELESKLADVEAILQSTVQEKEVLQQHVDGLQSELDAQKELIATLKNRSEQSDRLKAELDEAKRVILQLSEVNSKLTQASSGAVQPAVQQSEPASSKQTKQASSSQPSSDQTASRSQPKRSESSPGQLSLRQAPPRRSQPSQSYPLPKMPSENDTKLTDADIGWVD